MSAIEKIEPGIDFDEWQKAWFAIAKERGHVLRTYPRSRQVDTFVTSGGYCNGPGCKNCGWTACMHCDWKGERIPKCSAA